MSEITNKEIKLIRSLSIKKYRDEYNLFVVEGEKMVNEVLKSDFRIKYVFYREDIGYQTMKQISSLSNPSPVLAVVEKKQDRIPKTFLPSSLYLGLDTISDPGNLGTIIRAAEWFGIDAIFATKNTVDIYNPKVVQATMGAIFRLPFYYVDLQEVCNKIKEEAGIVYGTFLNGTNIYKENLKNNNPSIIIMGNESIGISKEVSSMVDTRLYIPKFRNKGSESLNVAIATSIVLSEFRRGS